ncbi:MAG: ABC transporter permease, partial [Candidatus Heimdallarchaeota archaeon]|nr:ABC transporter permease [Candidatus Heimdallarchaeota archaeon]
MIKISLRSYALRRILYIFPTLLGISIISFALIAASPGDPIQIRLGLWIGEQPEYEEVYNQVGFDIGVLDENGEPVSMFVRYFRWLGLVKDQYGVRSGILQGNLGNSWFYTMSGNIGKPISDIIVGRLWYTLFLTTPAFVISTILATIIGVIQATRQYSLWDKGVTLASLIGFSMPVFWLAKLVMLTAFYLFNFTGA